MTGITGAIEGEATESPKGPSLEIKFRDTIVAISAPTLRVIAQGVAKFADDDTFFQLMQGFFMAYDVDFDFGDHLEDDTDEAVEAALSISDEKIAEAGADVSGKRRRFSLSLDIAFDDRPNQTVEFDFTTTLALKELMAMSTHHISHDLALMVARRAMIESGEYILDTDDDEDEC